MKTVLLKKFGGPEMLEVGEREIPEPVENQVLIRVMATSVNRADLVQREGHYPPPPGESDILGLEVAGIIEKTGPGITDWQTGDRVMTLVGGGGYAEYAVAYASHLMAIPDSMTFDEAACVCEVYITAFLNIFLLGGFKDGLTAILHGGGGGVNTAGIQICRSLAPRARIIVTAAPEKLERVKALSADLVINFRETPDFADTVMKFTDGKGVDFILDHLGGSYLAPNMNSLAKEGTLVIIGVTGGFTAELNLLQMLVKRQRIMGSVLRSRPVEEKGKIVAEFVRRVVPHLADRSIVPLIHAVLPIERVADAHRMMEEDRHFGKIVLTLR